MENAEKEMPEDRFERIGTTYYKIVRQPNAAGELSERRLPWSIEAIRQDYGKDFLANIPKYKVFRGYEIIMLKIKILYLAKCTKMY